MTRKYDGRFVDAEEQQQKKISREVKKLLKKLSEKESAPIIEL